MVECLGQIFVLRRVGNRLVKSVVHTEKAVAVLGGDISLFLAQRLQHDEVIGRGPLGRQLGAEHFQRQAHLTDFLEIRRVDLGHIKAVAGRDDD